MLPDERSYNVWVIARPAADVPGQWVAHCLDLDVMSQGDSLAHALEMVHEAAMIVMVDELNQDRDPLERRAPAEFFSQLYGLFERGQKVTPAELSLAENEGRVVAYATQFELRFTRHTSEHEAAPRSMRPVPMGFAQQLAS
jgi:predicted RNase H-like HicB family nuclease